MLVHGTTLGTPELLSKKGRIRATAGGLILSWRDRPHLLWEMYFMGEHNFIVVMRRAEAEQAIADGAGLDPNQVPSINTHMTDAEYGEVYEALCWYVKQLERRGRAWRKRKDSTI